MRPGSGHLFRIIEEFQPQHKGLLWGVWGWWCCSDSRLWLCSLTSVSQTGRLSPWSLSSDAVACCHDFAGLCWRWSPWLLGQGIGALGGVC